MGTIEGKIDFNTEDKPGRVGLFTWWEIVLMFGLICALIGGGVAAYRGGIAEGERDFWKKEALYQQGLAEEIKQACEEGR